MVSLPLRSINFNGYVLLLFLLLITNFSYVYSENPQNTSVKEDSKIENPFPFPIDEESPLKEDTDRFFYQFMRMLGTLGLLIGFMLFASWFLKKLLNTRVQQVNTSSYIKVIESRPISNKSTLYLVESQGNVFIVGESANGLSLMVNHGRPLEATPDFN